MSIELSRHEHLEQLGESATYPIDLRCGMLAALLLLAGMSPQLRLALPARRITAHSVASNCRFQDNPKNRS